MLEIGLAPLVTILGGLFDGSERFKKCELLNCEIAEVIMSRKAEGTCPRLTS